MKKLLLPFCLVATFIFTIESCSVDKRLYRNGYHIEWAKKNKDVKDNAGNSISGPDDNLQESKLDNYSDDTLLAASTDQEPIVIKEKEHAFIAIPKDDDLNKKRKNNIVEFKKGFEKGFHILKKSAIEAPYQPLAIASLVLGILSLFAYYGSFVLGLLAIIFGVIAMRRIRNEPSTYRGSKMALIGLICGIVGIIIATSILSFY
jgi:hypothetical protein